MWRAFNDVRLLQTSGYATLLQVAHPTVGHGVHQYSSFVKDPWGRLLRTLDYVHGTIYGGPELAGKIGVRVRDMHKTIKGTKPDGSRYSAMEPDAFAWVHATLAHSIFEGYRVFVTPMSPAHEGGVLDASGWDVGSPDRGPLPRPARDRRRLRGVLRLRGRLRAGVDPRDPAGAGHPVRARRRPTCPACAPACGACCARPWAASCGWPPSASCPTGCARRLELPFSPAERRTFALLMAAGSRAAGPAVRGPLRSSAPTTCAGATRPWPAATWPRPGSAPAARTSRRGLTRRQRLQLGADQRVRPAALSSQPVPRRRPRPSRCARRPGGPPPRSPPARRPPAPAPPRPPPAPRAPWPLAVKATPSAITHSAAAGSSAQPPQRLAPAAQGQQHAPVAGADGGRHGDGVRVRPRTARRRCRAARRAGRPCPQGVRCPGGGAPARAPRSPCAAAPGPAGAAATSSIGPSAPSSPAPAPAGRWSRPGRWPPPGPGRSP